METKKIIAMLLATMLMVGTIGTSFADDDGDDDREERNEHRYEKNEDREDDDKYEKREKKHKEKKEDEEREHKYEKNDDRDSDDDRKNNKGEDKDDKRTNKIEKKEDNNDVQKKADRKLLKAKYKARFKVKLGNRLDSIPQTKLETIIILIDTKVLELEADTVKTTEQKEKLVVIYGAIRDLISDKISELNSNNVLDDLLK